MTHFMRDEHKKLTGLFRQLEALEVRSQQMWEPVVRELRLELAIYLALEKRILFPALPEFPQRAGILAAADELIQLVQTPNPDLDEMVSSGMAYLRQEDHELAPIIDQSGLTQRLNDAWNQQSERLRREYHTTQPGDPRHAQNPNGGEQSRKKPEEAA